MYTIKDEIKNWPTGEIELMITLERDANKEYVKGKCEKAGFTLIADMGHTLYGKGTREIAPLIKSVRGVEGIGPNRTAYAS